ncbi:hypothetical protein Tco_0329076, partial [Tanacetum coccineum]
MPSNHPLLQDFPHVPQVELPPLPLLLDRQDIFSQLADPNLYVVFGHGGSSKIAKFPYMPTCIHSSIYIQLAEFPYMPP